MSNQGSKPGVSRRPSCR